MGERKLIYVNRMRASSWWWIAGSFAVTAALIATDSGVWFAVAMMAVTAAVTIAVLWVIIRFFVQQIAEMVTDGDALDVEFFAMFGRGGTMRIPIADIENWYWYGRSSRYATLAFRYQGKLHRMPFNGPQLLDKDALRQLVPPAFEGPNGLR